MTVKVAKRSGELVPFDVEKIKKVIEWAKLGVEGFNIELDINPLKLESSLSGGVKAGTTTEVIQSSLIDKAKSFTTIQEPDWRYLAGRLLVMDYWKRVSKERGIVYLLPQDFPNHLREMCGKALYEFSLSLYSDSELVDAYGWIVEERDLDYDFAGANTLISRYVVKGELIQEMILVCSLLLAQNEVDKMTFARNVYEAVSTRKISLATPLLKNMRRPSGNASSCFTLETSDSLIGEEGSITQTWSDIAKISQEGGGCGCLVSKIRSKGSFVRGIDNASKGVVPWIKVLDSIAVAVDQTSTRPAAVTIALDIWHLDVEDFLELQTEAGDERSKAHNLYPQIVVPDEFMRRVRDDEDWTLVDPYEVKKVLGIDLVDLWGKEFEKAYRVIEASELKLKKTISAKDLFKKILKTWVATSMPYIAFKDAMNRTNPNKDDGVIKLVNLCIESFSNTSPSLQHCCLIKGTNVLTKDGWKVIEDCDGIEVAATFNSDKDLSYCQSYVKATLIDNGLKPAYKITLRNGRSITATNNHKFLVGKEWKEVKDINLNDALRLHIPNSPEEFTINQNKLDQSIGWLIGDGWLLDNVVGVCFGPKDVLAQYEVVDSLYKAWENIPLAKGGHKSLTKKTYTDLKSGVVSWACGSKGIRSWLEVNYQLYPNKAANKKLPGFIDSMSLSRVASILSGLFSADGCVVPLNTNNKSYIQLSSSSLVLLNQVRDQLLRFNIFSTVSWYQPKGRNPQGVVTINGKYIQLFNKYIGFNLSKEKSDKVNDIASGSTNSNHSQSSRVISIDYIGEVPVYDLNVPDKHHFVAEGIVVHNCNLVSLNGANLIDSELEHLVRTSVRILDNAIDITAAPTIGARNHNQRYRTLGIGFMGLHDWLARQNLSYQNTNETLGPISDLFEDIAYYSVDESSNLGLERGSFEAFEFSEWAKGSMIGKPIDWFINNANHPERWTDLSKKVRVSMRNSQLTAIAPNTGSSLIQGCTASVIPLYGKFYVDDNLKSKPPVCPPFIKDKFWYYLENKNMLQEAVIDTCTTIQNWICAGISMELLFDLNKEHVNASYIKDMFFRAWESDCKAIYYIRWIKKNAENVEVRGECTSCAN